MAEVGSARKRRELNGGEGHSPVKKLRLDDDEPPEANPNTLESVRHRNKEMALDLLEKNRRIAFLATKCESLFRQRAVATRAFRCIQRQWVQLVDDLGTATRVLNVETDEATAWHDVVAKTESLGVLQLPSDIVTVSLPEWFLAIRRGDKEVEAKDAADDEEDAEPDEVALEALSEKEEDIQRALEHEQHRVMDVLQNLLAAVGKETSKQLEFKDLVEQKRAATAQVLELKGDLAEMKHKLAEMQADLEAKEVERHQACRAYDRLKEFVEKNGGVAATETADEGKAETGASQTEQGAENGDAKATQRAGEKRVTLVDPEVKPSADRESLQRLHSEKAILLHKLKDERQNLESMRPELTRLRAVEAAHKQEEARLKQEFNATVSRLQEEKKHLSDEIATFVRHDVDQQRHVQEKWKSQLDKIQEDSAKTKAKVNELVFKNTALREKLASFSAYRDQLAEMKTQHESLKRETERLKEQLQREKDRANRNDQVAESKQLIDLRENLKLVQAELDEMKERAAKLSSSLEKSGDKKLSEACEREAEALRKLESLRAVHSKTKADAEKALAELETANANHDTFKDENDALVAEIQALSKEVESSRHSKKKVIKQLEEKRQAAKKMQSDLAKESDARLHATEELATVRLQVSSLKYVHTQQKAALEAAKEVQRGAEQELAELKRTLEALQTERDVIATEKTKADRDADIARQMYKAEANHHKQRQMLKDERRLCEKCESFRKKEADYEKRIAALRASVANASSAGDSRGGLSELERFELQDLRKQLKCSVCQDRHKDVIISKCSHLFCKECIDSNLRSRNRKCPTCKKMFGQDDVKSVWFT